MGKSEGHVTVTQANSLSQITDNADNNNPYYLQS